MDPNEILKGIYLQAQVCYLWQIFGISGPQGRADKTWDSHLRISLWCDLEAPEVDQTSNTAAPPQDGWTEFRKMWNNCGSVLLTRWGRDMPVWFKPAKPGLNF